MDNSEQQRTAGLTAAPSLAPFPPPGSNDDDQGQAQQSQEPLTRSDSTDSYTFLPREERNRNLSNTRGSILPHSGFYAPAKKRPAAGGPGAGVGVGLAVGTPSSATTLARTPTTPSRSAEGPDGDDATATPTSPHSPLGQYRRYPAGSEAEMSTASRPAASPLDGVTTSTASSLATWTAPSTSHGSASGHRLLGSSGAGSNTPNTRSRDPLLPMKSSHSQLTRGPLVGTPPAAARRSATRSRNSGNGQASGDTDQEKASSSQGRHPPATSRGTMLHPPGYSQTKERNYTHHSGSNAFLLRGLIMTSHSNPLPFLASLFVTLALGGLWLGFEAPYQWREASPAIPLIFGYLFAGTVVNMGVTAGRDPGVLPRGVDEESILALPDGDDQDTSSAHPFADLDPESRRNGNGSSRRDDALLIPMPRIVRVRNGRDLTVKWCETCRLYRPPRASHCRVCDNCVEAIDHHCTFLNTCIARRNYMSFFAFLGLALATCAYGVVFCALHLYWLTLPSDSPSGRGGGKSGLGGALGTSPMSGVLFVLILLVMGPLTTLTCYHVRLIMMGRSTVEQMRINTSLSHTYPRPSPLYHFLSGVCCGLIPFGGSASSPDSSEDQPSRPLPLLRLGDAKDDPNPFAYRSAWRNVVYTLCRPSVTARVRFGAGGGSAVGGGMDRRGRRWVDERGLRAR